jgi:uroporphyrinogen-III decarboxylase
MVELTSRERMLRAIDLRPVDYVPCCLMSFSALRKRHRGDRYKVVEAQRAMGFDAMLFIPTAPRSTRPEHPDLRGLPVRLPEDVEVEEWREDRDGGRALLHKVYYTPKGPLSTTVALSDDWPHGDHIPLMDDYQIPRAVKPLITTPEDLEVLRYLLQPPTRSDITAFRAEAEQARAFADEHGVLLAGGWGVGMDMANWLCGMQDLMILMLQAPDFVDDLLAIIHEWTTRRMEVVLSAPVDLFLRRAWYEGCDFVTPAFYRRSILPRLKAEVDLAHAHDARFGYICTSGMMPMLDCYGEAGFDVLVGVDPEQGSRTDMAVIREELGGKLCIWGGVSGAITVERGSPSEVRDAVRRAVETFGHEGFILSPVDNITVDAPRTWENLEVFAEVWREVRSGGR